MKCTFLFSFFFLIIKREKKIISFSIQVRFSVSTSHNAERAKLKRKNFQKPNLFVILLLLLVDGGLGDPVQIPLATLRDAAAALVLVLLEHADLLQRLHHLAVDGPGGVDVVGRAGTTVLGGAVDLAQTANTDGLAHVDVTGDGGGTDVVP